MRLADVTGRPLASACTNTGIEAGRPLTLCSKGVRVRDVYLAVLVAARTLDRLTPRGGASGNDGSAGIATPDGCAERQSRPGVPRGASLWGAA